MHHAMLTADDWAELALRHTAAYNWMVRRSLRRELAYLEGVIHPNTWQEARLKELRQLQSDIASYTCPAR